MKQLILLAGLHKTATTSIQQSCAANQQALYRVGFAYPTLSHAGQEKLSNHTKALNWFRREPEKAGLLGQFRWPGADPKQRDAFLARFADSLKALPANLVMAAEGVSLFSADELETMKAWFAGQGLEIRLFCHVRHLGSWMNSMISQRVTSGIALPIGVAVDEYLQSQSIVRRRIETIRSVFPRAEFYSHEQAIQHPAGPVGFFMDNAGIKGKGRFRVVRANEGSSDLATRIVSVLNEKFGRFDAAGAINPDFFDNQPFIDQVKRIGRRKFTLRPDEVAPILPLLEADNAWLAETLGQQFHDRNLRFEEVPFDWTPQDVAEFERTLAKAPPPVRDWVDAHRAAIGLQPRG